MDGPGILPVLPDKKTKTEKPEMKESESKDAAQVPSMHQPSNDQPSDEVWICREERQREGEKESERFQQFPRRDCPLEGAVLVHICVLPCVFNISTWFCVGIHICVFVCVCVCVCVNPLPLTIKLLMQTVFFQK